MTVSAADLFSGGTEMVRREASEEMSARLPSGRVAERIWTPAGRGGRITELPSHFKRWR